MRQKRHCPELPGRMPRRNMPERIRGVRASEGALVRIFLRRTASFCSSPKTVYTKRDRTVSFVHRIPGTERGFFLVGRSGFRGLGMTKGEVTRQKIIEQAAPLFNRLGYAGCSMQDIMAATGLEKGGLYRHFSSKEELAEEAFCYSLARVTEARWGGIEEVEGAVERLRFLIRRFVDIHSIFPGGCPVMNTA